MIILAEFKIGGEERQVVKDNLLDIIHDVQEICDQGIILDHNIDYDYLLSEFGELELRTIEGIYISIKDLIFCWSEKIKCY